MCQLIPFKFCCLFPQGNHIIHLWIGDNCFLFWELSFSDRLTSVAACQFITLLGDNFICKSAVVSSHSKSMHTYIRRHTWDHSTDFLIKGQVNLQMFYENGILSTHQNLPRHFIPSHLAMPAIWIYIENNILFQSNLFVCTPLCPCKPSQFHIHHQRSLPIWPLSCFAYFNWVTWIPASLLIPLLLPILGRLIFSRMKTCTKTFEQHATWMQTQ